MGACGRWLCVDSSIASPGTMTRAGRSLRVVGCEPNASIATQCDGQIKPKAKPTTSGDPEDRRNERPLGHSDRRPVGIVAVGEIALRRLG